MAMVNPLNQIALNPNAKDSRWLTLEVCREFQRNKCTRSENECKFAHPPPHVEVQNGRVIACFDSIKGKCQRKDPPCKYLHPPQHLREQLLQNGRNNLIIKSLQIQAIQGGQMMPGIIPLAAPTPAKTLTYQTVLPGQIPYMVGNQPQTSEQVQAINQMQGNILRWTSQGIPNASGWTTQGISIRNGASGDGPFGPQFLSTAPSSVMQFQSPYNIQTMAIPGGADGSMVTQQLTGVIPTPIPNKAPQRPDRLEPQVVEVLTKKRPRDPAEELVLPMGLGLPPYKRVHMDGSHLGKGGALPVYGHQSIQTNPYAQAATLMQLQQQPYIPVTYSGEVMSAAYPNYLPQDPHLVVAAAQPAGVGAAAAAVIGTLTPSPVGATASSVSLTRKAPLNAYSVQYFDHNKQLLDTLPLCPDFEVGCHNPICRKVHVRKSEVEINSDGRVVVCRDSVRNACNRQTCKYYHIPVPLPPST